MKKVLVITDVTRMREGRVCIAGYDRDGNCIRPTLPPPGISEAALYVQGNPTLIPFAEIECDLLQPIPDPPHVEDCRYNPQSIRFLRRLREDEKKVILEKTLFPSLSALLETPIHTGQGYYVLTGRGPRSLGTIRPKAVLEVIYGIHEGRNPEYRLVFVDGDSVERNLPITDLSWRYYLDYMRGQGLRPNRVASDLLMVLRSVEVFLRIGLARGWEKFPDRCYIQIVGIHTFPDFLKGRTFADFAPDRPTTTVDENP